jgi:hypothetical protein
MGKAELTEVVFLVILATMGRFGVWVIWTSL